jgi:hypothetical protein
MGGSLAGVAWVVNVANLKAARRTGDPACGFSAEVRLHGADYAPRLRPTAQKTAPPAGKDHRPAAGEGAARGVIPPQAL